jgi:ABC-2 type transport system ATP-binding protein
MSSEYTIEVKNVKKKFKVYYDKGRSLKEKVLFRNRNRYEEHWVLNGISFNVKKGEAIGIIGHNGCGKSTTLKLLTKIMYPDEGSIEIKGRVSSLIELGAGFHPDMSGRENIYTNASIFGLTRKEIDARLQDIIEFSELEEYLDNPVRTYSSGMYMRLAFSVAINVDADVLLVDEILAVGDINFQAKCFNKLREIKANGQQ